jgi:hypothetical protein
MNSVITFGILFFLFLNERCIFIFATENKNKYMENPTFKVWLCAFTLFLWKYIHIIIFFYLGNKLEIILSASSGVGGEYFPSGGTGCGGWDDVSSVDGKSGTNLALLEREK